MIALGVFTGIKASLIGCFTFAPFYAKEQAMAMGKSGFFKLWMRQSLKFFVLLPTSFAVLYGTKNAVDSYVNDWTITLIAQ